MFRDALRLSGLILVILMAGTAIASFTEATADRPDHAPRCRMAWCGGCTAAEKGRGSGEGIRMVGPEARPDAPPLPRSGTRPAGRRTTMGRYAEP